MRRVAGNVFFYEMATDRACGESIKIAREATPLGEMIRNIKSRRRGSGVFIVDESHGVDLAVAGQSRARLHNDVATEEVRVTKDKLAHNMLARNPNTASGVSRHLPHYHLAQVCHPILPPCVQALPGGYFSVLSQFHLSSAERKPISA